MQVVILCGGQGTRIRDVSDEVPKPMIPIGEEPILWHIMSGFAQHGYNRFVLCLGYKSWVIKRFFLDYHLARNDVSLTLGGDAPVRLHPPLRDNHPFEITLAETGIEANTGCRIKRIERYIQGDDFLMTYGDGVADVDIQRLVGFHRAHGKTATITAVHPPGRFGELDIEGASVREFCEKPSLSRGRINGGFMVFNRKVFKYLRDEPELILEREPLSRLASAGELMAYEHDGFWHPMDNSRDYRYLNELWASGQAAWAAKPATTVQRAA